jgi:hypothetical protein
MSSIPSVSSSVFVPQAVQAQAASQAPRPPDSDGDHDGSKAPSGGGTGRTLNVTA